MAILYLRAKPNARTNELLVAADGTVTVRLKAPPQEGQANVMLLAFLAEVFGTSKNQIELLSGHTAPFKKVALRAIDDIHLTQILANYQE